MSSMNEIYLRHAQRYDALVVHEDHQGNLRDFLRSRFPWKAARVVESGLGTGRVTALYADLAAVVMGFDRSPHMLESARANLGQWLDKVDLRIADHMELPVDSSSADLFVEGWAFGHAVLDSLSPGGTGVAATTRGLLGEVNRILSPGGTAIVIETLGTNVGSPAPPLPALGGFYDRLAEAGFVRAVIPTDYRFDSREEAARICGFFFGEQMRADILAGEPVASSGRSIPGRPDAIIIPEFTGIWSRVFE